MSAFSGSLTHRAQYREAARTGRNGPSNCAAHSTEGDFILLTCCVPRIRYHSRDETAGGSGTCALDHVLRGIALLGVLLVNSCLPGFVCAGNRNK